jgi:hypothetical protein
MSETEYKASIKMKYMEMLEKYPEVDTLEVGEFNAFTPYAFLHHNMQMWLPSQEQKEAALEQLPYLEKDSFVKLMHDERSETDYAFIRTPEYYATFNSGKIITEQQRYGLGILWTPKLGTIFQSQSRTNEAAWGTLAMDSVQVYEARDVLPELYLEEMEAGKSFKSSEISYALGKNGNKTITFNANNIKVQVSHSGFFKEILPVVVSTDDVISVNGGQIKIETKSGTFVITTSEKEGILLKEFESDLEHKTCKIVEISAKNKLSYEFVFR